MPRKSKPAPAPVSAEVRILSNIAAVLASHPVTFRDFEAVAEALQFVDALLSKAKERHDETPA